MKEVFCVFYQIDGPSEDGDPGRVTEGYYIVEDGELVMTNCEGDPVWINGREFKHRLALGDDPARIAKRLTGEIHRLLKGDQSPGRRLVFPDVGVA